MAPLNNTVPPSRTAREQGDGRNNADPQQRTSITMLVLGDGAFEKWNCSTHCLLIDLLLMFDLCVCVYVCVCVFFSLVDLIFPRHDMHDMT